MAFTNKQEMLSKLLAYRNTPDDDNIRYKQKIKTALKECPELLYCLHEKKFEKELFNEDGTFNDEGNIEKYFGATSNIRDFLSIPDVQTDAKSIICYQTYFNSEPKYNAMEKYAVIAFTIFVYSTDNSDPETGIARHDLLASIIREKFNWSNIFGATCEIISDKEGVSDTNYVTRTITFRTTVTKSVVRTGKDGTTRYVNKNSLRVNYNE